jgi:hypothetical protein
MAATGLAYARFMDDWVIPAPTRWKLREAIRLVTQTLAARLLSTLTRRRRCLTKIASSTR